MVTDIRSIKSTYWQKKRGSFGEVVEEIEDINQCLQTIVTTRKGSVPHVPDLGSDIWLELDKPINEAIPAIIQKVYNDIPPQEPRITIQDANVIAEVSHLYLYIDWVFKNSDEINSTEVTLK